MSRVLHRLGGRRMVALAAVIVFAAIGASAAAGANGNGKGAGNDRLSRLDHIVVIYEENHSFDNLYGGWEGVNGLANADPRHTTQVDQNGVPFTCLLQNDVNLVGLPATCNDTAHGFSSAFSNTWWTIDSLLPPTATTCPTVSKAFAFPFGVPEGQGLPGGCTRDLVHKFYQEQFQLDGGRQDRYATGSDAAGMTMGVYDTRALPIYRYLHSGGHPHYAIADNFFQSAFGGSFLNHQWLIAATTPVFPNAVSDGTSADRHSVVDRNGMVQTRSLNATWGLATYPLYVSPDASSIRDRELTVKCGSTALPLACGDYAVNTSQPPYRPFGAFGAKLPAQTNPTIGDRLSAGGIDWAWYAGGWSNANGDVDAPGWTNGNGPTCADPEVDPSAGIAVFPHCPSNVFQYHHQPFNYFKAFDPDTPEGLANRRAHLRDEQEFIQTAQASGKDCALKPVSFIKPFGLENEHPGYSSETGSDNHLVSLLQTIENSACAKNTMVIVTYDEFGGEWDHVPPPGTPQNPAAPGRSDIWGPGTRIPTLVVSPFLRGNEVFDHTQYDTTSILATIEQRYGLRPLSTRDASVNSLADVFDAKQYESAK
jgi:acid phosphatase